MNNEEKTGLEIIEENTFEPEESNKDFIQFYEDNKELIDSLGGIEIIGSIMEINDEDFETIKSEMLNIFIDSLSDPAIEKDLKTIIITENLTSETIKNEFDEALQIIESIDSISESKKYFIKTIFTMTAGKLQDLIPNTNKSIKIPCELEENVQIPTYAHKTDAGVDIYAKEEITIAPNETKIIGTGIKMAIPEGYAILIQPRSGQSVKTKLRIANTPGLIDSGYRDEIGVIIENIEPPFKNIEYEFDDDGEIHIKSIEHGQSYTIVEGQRFAQMRLVQVPKAEFVKTKNIGEIGEDRGGGFGSTDNIG
jgi:dUTP pyrophosphatase